MDKTYFDPTLIAVVAALAILSGVGSFMQHVRENKADANAFNFIYELIVSLSASLCMYFLGEWQSLPKPLICLASLIAASNGGWFMQQARLTLINKLNSKV